MKTLKKMIPICLLALALVISITLLTPKTQAATESDLTFKLNSDGNGYTVSDCNTSASGELIIPATYNGKPVTTIGNAAFRGCSSLTSITIPDSVTTIGKVAFYYCSNLTSITIPDSVTSIGSSVFSGCSSLTSITIPDGVTTIGNYAFFDCSSLTSVIIPDSVTTIGDWAFNNCSSLNYNIYGNAKYLGNANNPYCALISATSTYLTECTIAESTKVIGNSAFSGCSSLTSVTIPDGVTTIGYSAFEYCSSLTSVTIPDSVTTIGGSAFYNCSSLTALPSRIASPPLATMRSLGATA